MSDPQEDFWTDETSVFFTSFWGWTPETWGTVGWTGDRGHTRRANLLRELTDPFIAVVYVTSNKSFIDSNLKGKIAGFYLMSHELGDRDDFTHPLHHQRSPEKWRHSLRALRAFSYLPEHRLTVGDLNPELIERARHVAAMGEVLTNHDEIDLLRKTPWIEVEVYTPVRFAAVVVDPLVARGYVRAGPANESGYIVSASAEAMKRELYVLRLEGDTGAYVGRACGNCAIYKIGLAVSPELRRQSFQKAMPRGAFTWTVDRATGRPDSETGASFECAVVGEDAMKRHLASCSEWLGGEFYLATEAQIDKAWELGLAAMQKKERDCSVSVNGREQTET